MTGPVRIQLSRRKGFRLQQVSLALNGLPAVKVDRTTMWGNRWKIGTWSNHLGRPVATVDEAVSVYKALMWTEPHGVAWVRERLGNKNLGCWCKLPAKGEPDLCHAAVLLELANYTCEQV